MTTNIARAATGDNASNRRFAHEPSSEKQLRAEAKQQTKHDFPDDPNLSPEQRAWEMVLKQNLGDFYYPRYLDDKEKGLETAWDYVNDDPRLPRVLIIGDSISRGYTLTVRHALAEKVNLHRAPANCGCSANGLTQLPVWLGQGRWDLILFNFGIHDRETPSEIYQEHLEWIVNRLRQTGARLVWVSSTPVLEGAAEYHAGSIERLNGVANALMRRHEIPVVDLYGHVLPVLDKYQLPRNCHYQQHGYEYLGQFVAQEIGKAIKLTM